MPQLSPRTIYRIGRGGMEGLGEGDGGVGRDRGVSKELKVKIKVLV